MVEPQMYDFPLEPKGCSCYTDNIATLAQR